MKADSAMLDTGTLAIDAGAYSLSGTDKAAILLLALGNDHASKVLKLFDPEELKVVARSLAELKPVPSAVLAELVEDFAQVFSSGTDLVSTIANIETLMSGVMTQEQIAQAVSNSEAAPVVDEPPWGELGDLKGDVMVSYLANEHAQTIAFCLSHLGSDFAAKALPAIPADDRSGIICRMLDINEPGAEVIREVEEALREDLLEVEETGHSSIAEILNKLEKPQTDDLLSSIGSSRPKDVVTLKSLLFSFEDIVLLEAKYRSALMEVVPMDQMVIALAGVDEEFQSTILSSLGARARRMAEAELQNSANVSGKQVTDARRAIVKNVLDMMARGEITRSPVSQEA